MAPAPRTAVVDVDGTLVDSVYHHALCWHRAFADGGFTIPVWRCHRKIGMGGDQLVPALIGERGEREHGDALREAEGDLFAEQIDRVAPLEGAADLVRALTERGHEVVLSSSAQESEVERHIEVLEIGEDVVGHTSANDVDASKPDPDLVHAALEKSKLAEATMIGDSVWDVRAADRAGIGCIGLLSGGFAESELEDAGAVAVFASPADLLDSLNRTELA
jgi:HAD superfamily hydrolase (TIGR01509 family)